MAGFVAGTNGRGVKALLDRFERLRQKAVYVGVPAEHNPPVAKFNMASLAAVLEFGSADGRIPPRPFLRQTLAENQQKYADLFADLFKQGKAPNAIYETIALIAQGDVQQNIVNGGWVPNAPSTIKRKGSSKPLIDTGRLRQSVRGVVR